MGVVFFRVVFSEILSHENEAALFQVFFRIAKLRELEAMKSGIQMFLSTQNIIGFVKKDSGVTPKMMKRRIKMAKKLLSTGADSDVL